MKLKLVAQGQPYSRTLEPSILLLLYSEHMPHPLELMRRRMRTLSTKDNRTSTERHEPCSQHIGDIATSSPLIRKVCKGKNNPKKSRWRYLLHTARDSWSKVCGWRKGGHSDYWWHHSRSSHMDRLRKDLHDWYLNCWDEGSIIKATYGNLSQRAKGNFKRCTYSVHLRLHLC